MEMSQGNSPCNYTLNKQKCHFFLLSTKSENRKVEQVLFGMEVSGLVPVGGRRWQGKGVGG
jgi:hypothetical protein